MHINADGVLSRVCHALHARKIQIQQSIEKLTSTCELLEMFTLKIKLHKGSVKKLIIKNDPTMDIDKTYKMLIHRILNKQNCALNFHVDIESSVLDL